MATRPPTKPTPRRGTPPGEIRIVGGQWKRTKLAVADRDGLRPTPDRVRETLFNWLGQDLQGWQVLDAFAGTGALGFEAASRGAAHVQMLERDASLLPPMRALQAKLKDSSMAFEAADALLWMKRAEVSPRRYDLVLLDPPFGQGVHAKAIALAANLLKPNGWLYVEASEAMTAPAGMQAHRHLRAGAVHAHLWLAASTALVDQPASTPPVHRPPKDDDDRED